MADVFVQLKNQTADTLYPRTTLDNIVLNVSSSDTLIAPSGKIISTYLPTASTSGSGIVQLEGDISSATGTALNNPPTTDAVKTYVNAQILAGVTCELIND